MGTNYYLRRKEPTIREAVHIGKMSFGWLFHWDACDSSDWPRWCDTDHIGGYGDGPKLPFSINSVEDIREYLRTGEWELVDEYGEVYEDWVTKIESFKEWDGGKAAYNKNHPDKPVTWNVSKPFGSVDREGQIFSRDGGFC